MRPDSTCDVQGCPELQMLRLQRATGAGTWIDVAFCERHALDVSAQREVLDRVAASVDPGAGPRRAA